MLTVPRRLTNVDGLLDQDRGRVELHVVWRHNTTLKVEVPRDLEDDSFAFVDERLVPPTELNVFVARAKGLVKECDPYVRVDCDAHAEQTLARSKTTKPLWKDTLVLGPVEGDAAVTLSLFDKKPKGTKDKLLGKIDVPLSLLRNKCPVRRWLPFNGLVTVEEVARCLMIDTNTRGNEDREALALAKRSACYYSSDEESEDGRTEDPAERLERARKKVRVSLKALAKSTTTEADHATCLNELDQAQAAYDADETLTAQCTSEEQEQVRDYLRDNRTTSVAGAGEALGVFTAKIFHRWVLDVIAARPPPPDPNAPVAHEASPLEYADFTPPKDFVGALDVWFAWRHAPKHFYRVARGLEEDFFPERIPNEATVCVIRAKRLLACKEDESRNPMVTLKLKGTDASKHTRVLQSRFPLWGQAFYLPALEGGTVDCVVEDVDDPGPYQTTTFLGTCAVPLTPCLDLPQRGSRSWYALCNSKNKAEDSRGILELYVAYRHNLDLAVIDVPEEHAKDMHPQQDANELVIVVIRARHLGKRGTPPSEGPLSTVRMTSGSWAPLVSTERRGISPLWMERFALECEDLEASLKLEVVEGDTVLGSTTLDVKTLAGRKPVRAWHSLVGVGDLEVCLHWHHSRAVKIEPLALETQPAADRRVPLNSLVMTVLRCRGLRRQDVEKRQTKKGRVRKSRQVEEVEVESARPAHPRVRIEVGDLPHVVTDAFTEGPSRAVTRTFNPNFMKAFRFDDVYEASLIARIYVEHTEEGKKTKPELLGKCAVPVKALSHRRALRRWLTLEDRKGRADPTLGRIELCLRWCHNSQLEVELPEEGQKDLFMSKAPNELFVVLIRARNLTPQTRKQDNQADPFVVLSCAGSETRSTTKKYTLNPRWVERYTWDADDSTDVLDITVRDVCPYSGDIFLGRVGVEMDALRKRTALRKFLTLKNAEDYQDDQRGSIEVLMHWRHNPGFTPKKFLEEGESFDKEGAPNCLVVVLVRAKKLRRLEKYADGAGTTDPQCFLTLDGERKRSRIIENQPNPHWNQSFKFPDTEDLKVDRDTQHYVHVDVFDVDESDSHVTIASCKVPCAKLKDRKPFRAWYWLSHGDDEQEHQSGKVELILRWVHDPSLILKVTGDDICEDEDYEQHQPNEVSVHVVRCRHLLRTSRSLLSKDTSNPFVRISTKFQNRRTKRSVRTVAPVYQKRFSFESRAGDEDLLVEVYDAGQGGNDDLLFMGRARLAIKDLRDREPMRRWLTLTDEYGRKDQRRGQVEVVAWHFYRGKYVAPIPNRVDDDPAVEGPCNQLCICLVRAWNLPVKQHKAKDGNIGAADPFVVLRCGDQERATQVEEHTVHPLWQETYKFLAPEATEVRLDVWDYDGLRANAWVGSCTFKTTEIEQDKDARFRAWLPLRDEVGQLNGSRGLVELYARWHTSLKLWSPPSALVEVADGVTEARVYRPGRPSGLRPEQLIVSVKRIMGLTQLQRGTCVSCRIRVRSDTFETTPRVVTEVNEVCIQEKCHFSVGGVEGPGYWDGPPVVVELMVAQDASSAPDWGPAVLASARVPIHEGYMRTDATIVDLANGLRVEVFLRWRHLQNARTYEGSRRLACEAKKPKKAFLEKGVGLSKLLDGAQAYGESDVSESDAESEASSHLRGYVSAGDYSAASDDDEGIRVDAVEINVTVEAARGLPAPRFVELEASVGVSCVDAHRQDDQFRGSYVTEPARAAFASSHAVGAKFADVAFISSQRLVVAPSSVLRFSVSARGAIQERRYVSRKPLRCLGFCRMWLKAPCGTPRTFTRWLQVNGGSLSSQEWTEDRGELRVAVEIIGPASMEELVVDEPWRQEVEEVPPFGLDQLRDLPPLDHKALAPLVLPETFIHTGGLRGPRLKNARAYRLALSKLPLVQATDEKSRRRLVEQHFMRVAGYAVASRILNGTPKADDLPPPGKRRWDGSGYFYPAGAPDPRRPRGAYPDTKASTLRYDASVAWRDNLAGAAEKIDHSKPVPDPGARLWRCGRTFSLLPGKRKPGEGLPDVS